MTFMDRLLTDVEAEIIVTIDDKQWKRELAGNVTDVARNARYVYSHVEEICRLLDIEVYSVLVKEKGSA